MIEPEDVARLGCLISSMHRLRADPPAEADLRHSEQIHDELTRAAVTLVLRPVSAANDASAAA